MITKIQLSNFKAFLDLELNLSGLNILSGMNGLGKSSVIQALLLLRQSYQSKTLADKGLTLSGDLINLGKGEDVLCIEAPVDQITFELEFDYATTITASYYPSPFTDLLPLIAFNKTGVSQLDEISLFSNNFRYLHTERVSPKSFTPASYYNVEQLGSIGSKGEFTSHFLSKNQREKIQIPELKFPDSKAETLIEQIDLWLGAITPGAHIKPILVPDFDIARTTFHFEKGVDTTKDFSALNVGFGFTYVLPVITAILASNTGDLIIIENPETHIHPQGQAILGALIAQAAKGGVQLIIETHSDHLLNGIRVAVKNGLPADLVSIYFFERDIKSNQHITRIIQPVIDKNGRLNKQPKGFFDEYSKQLDKLLR